MATIQELRDEKARLEKEADSARAMLRDSEERAELEAEIRAAKATIIAGKIATQWEKIRPIAEAKKWRIGRMALGEGDSYAEVFFRHATEQQIKDRPATDSEARAWLADRVIWYPPAGDGAIDRIELMKWLDGYMEQWPATWATLMDRVMSLSLETAEIVRGKA